MEQEVYRIKEKNGVFFIETQGEYDQEFNWRKFKWERRFFWITAKVDNNGGAGFSDLISAQNKINELKSPIIYHSV